MTWMRHENLPFLPPGVTGGGITTRDASPSIMGLAQGHPPLSLLARGVGGEDIPGSGWPDQAAYACHF